MNGARLTEVEETYKTIIRLVALYGPECWHTDVSLLRKLHLTEIKIFRWMNEIAREGKTRNEFITGSLGITETYNRKEDLGHVKRREVDLVGAKVMDF